MGSGGKGSLLHTHLGSKSVLFGAAIFILSEMQVYISFDPIILLQGIYATEIFPEIFKDIFIIPINYV